MSIPVDTLLLRSEIDVVGLQAPKPKIVAAIKRPGGRLLLKIGGLPKEATGMEDVEMQGTEMSDVGLQDVEMPDSEMSEGEVVGKKAKKKGTSEFRWTWAKRK